MNFKDFESDSLMKKTRIITHYLVVPLIIIVFTLGCGEDDGISSTDPEPTHTMQEVYDDINRGIEYTDQRITIKATVIDVSRETANEDELKLDTSKLVKDRDLLFYIIAERDKYEIGGTYTFTLLIEETYCEYPPDESQSFCVIIGRKI